MRYVVLMALCLMVSGCKNAGPSTPKEQEEQEQRMRVFLDETSPRNMNNLPKVTPEFKKTFNTRGSDKKSGASASKSAESQEDKEDW